MITEDYVSFETAKLLKEKGFKHWCYKSYGDAVYHKGVPISFDEECELKSEGLEDEIEYVEGGCLYDFGCDNRKKDGKVWAAPTLWVAMKWLREVHNLGVFPTTYYREINRNVKHDYGSTIVKLDTYEVIGNDKNIEDYTFEAETYEETAEKAIRYCLENLI